MLQARRIPVVGFLVLCPILFAGGCGGGTQAPATKGTAKQAETTRSQSDLPALDVYLPPLDDGRVEVAGPKGWYYSPRSAKYVFRVQRTAKEGLPLIEMIATDWSTPAQLDAKNVSEFIRELATAQKKDPKSYQPMEIAGRTWVAYRRRAREPGRVGHVMEILALDTVVNGRRYTLRLACDPRELERWEPYLRAVAGGVRFQSVGEPLLAADTTRETPASEKPTLPSAPAVPEAKEPAPAPEKLPASTPAAEPPASSAKPQPAKPQPPKSEEPSLDLDALEEILR
jgi:hypothetical protein